MSDAWCIFAWSVCVSPPLPASSVGGGLGFRLDEVDGRSEENCLDGEKADCNQTVIASVAMSYSSDGDGNGWSSDMEVSQTKKARKKNPGLKRAVEERVLKDKSLKR